MAVPSLGGTSGIMTKTELRATAKTRRTEHAATLSLAERHAAAIMLAACVEAHIGEARCVAAYLPIDSEIDSLPIIDRLAGRGVALALPRVASGREPMRFLRWVPGDPLVAGPFGLRQPEPSAQKVEPDVILTPMLAFDATLHRLGYGAGHYDRAFAALPDARRIGLAWASQCVEALPVDPWDVALHAIATETDWIAP